MFKAVLVKALSSFVQMVSHELPPEIFVEKVIPFVAIEFLDLSQFRFGHELFDVPVLANRWVYPNSDRVHQAARPHRAISIGC
jgi:hypothetical protein